MVIVFEPYVSEYGSKSDDSEVIQPENFQKIAYAIFLLFHYKLILILADQELAFAYRTLNLNNLIFTFDLNPNEISM